MFEPADGGQVSARAFLRVGGVSVARQQLALALALQCERVICLARGLPPELVELQHVAERSGAQFNVIGGSRALVGLVTATDDVILIGDGLFAGVADAAALLEKGPGVLVQPIEQGLAAGFERIDLNSSSAAAMRLPGRLVERLGDLGDDCDAFSALQRIALQGGVPQRSIPATNGKGLFWSLVRTEQEAHALEPRWIGERIASTESAGPGLWLARRGVRLFGPALLHAGSGSGAVVVTALVIGVLALGAGWFGLFALALALCGLGWLLRQSAALLARIEDTGIGAGRIADLRREIYCWALDGAIVAITAWGTIAEPGQTLLHRYFPPLILVALLRIVPRATGGRWAAWLDDRILLCLVLASAITAGVGGEVVHIAALLLALTGIAVPRGELRITRP